MQSPCKESAGQPYSTTGLTDRKLSPKFLHTHTVCLAGALVINMLLYMGNSHMISGKQPVMVRVESALCNLSAAALKG